MTATRNVSGIPVRMPDGTVFTVRKLLGKGDTNTKLAKSDLAGKGFATLGLSLAPATVSGYQVCPHASKGCKAACIYTAGMGGVFRSVPRARVAKTRAWFQNRAAFQDMLMEELRAGVRRAERLGVRLAVRLNVFSDIPWERVWPELLALFPAVQFYDYSKSVMRALVHAIGDFPPNYHLTFSRSEANDVAAINVLRAGGNVAVVFDRRQLPRVWQGFPVIDGDETDLRFLDGRGVVVGLYAKGKGKQDRSGFVVRNLAE